MKKALVFFLALAVLTSVCQSQTQAEAEVRSAFERYKDAILHDRGEEAAGYLDKTTLEYYGAILNKVKTADSSEVEKMALMDKIVVFAIRHIATPKEILSFDARGLVVFAISKGLVGKNSMVFVTLGDVVVDGNSARVQTISRGKVSTLYLQLNKEDGIWKVDITTLFAAANVAFRTLVDTSGREENEFLFSLLEMMTQVKPSAAIWNTISN